MDPTWRWLFNLSWNIKIIHLTRFQYWNNFPVLDPTLKYRVSRNTLVTLYFAIYQLPECLDWQIWTFSKCFLHADFKTFPTFDSSLKIYWVMTKLVRDTDNQNQHFFQIFWSTIFQIFWCQICPNIFQRYFIRIFLELVNVLTY